MPGKGEYAAEGMIDHGLKSKKMRFHRDFTRKKTNENKTI